MGMITIKLEGSFGQDEMRFSAEPHGHAHAINQAQEYLTEQMRQAINGDHRLRSQNFGPTDGFIRQKVDK